MFKLRDKIGKAILGTNFSIEYEQREDGFETLRLYEQTFYKNDPTKPHKYSKEVGSILKSKYDDGWDVYSDVKDEYKLGKYGCCYMYKINGRYCETIQDGISLFIEALTRNGIKIKGI